MNNIVKRAILASILVLALLVTAAAAPIDSSRTGSLTLFKYAGTTTATPLSGVTFSVYRLASFDTDTSMMLPVSDYAAVIPLDENGGVDTETLSGRLSTVQGYITDNNLAAVRSGTTDSDGYVLFNELPLGIYLVLETDAPARVTERSANFFVSVPMSNSTGAGWVYDVTAYPKNVVTRTTTPTETLTRPTSTTSTSTSSTVVTREGTTSGPAAGTGGGDEVNIADGQTPLGSMSTPLSEITDIPVPLAETFDLPKTGGGLAVEILTLSGPALMLLGLISILFLGTKRRRWNQRMSNE